VLQIEIEEIEVGEKSIWQATQTVHLNHGKPSDKTKSFESPYYYSTRRRLQEPERYNPQFLGLYSNVRPCKSLHPFVSTKHPVMDIVIVRENEEDLYAGIEHQQTDEVVQCLKLISRPGCEKIVRYAFEYAKQQNRKKVTCFTRTIYRNKQTVCFTRCLMK
jgi:isocitrate dehydrogenase